MEAPSPPDAFVRALLPLLHRFSPGGCGAAIGGSHAHGSADSLSDVDVYLFSRSALPARERDAAVIDALGGAAAPASWGGDDPFVQAGTDFTHDGARVEVWLRNATHVDAAIAAAERGEVRREFVGWTVMGFLGHVVLADVRAMRILDDPEGMLAAWKARLRTFPAPLRAALLRRFMAEAAFWPDNPHYCSAVARGDVIYTSGIVQQVVHALVQVVFALNRAYFPGEKRLAGKLHALPTRPDDLADRIEALLRGPTGTSPAALDAQRRALATLVTETRSLVEADVQAGGRRAAVTDAGD
jgi:hypothetical protein